MTAVIGSAAQLTVLCYVISVQEETLIYSWCGGFPLYPAMYCFSLSSVELEFSFQHPSTTYCTENLWVDVADSVWVKINLSC